MSTAQHQVSSCSSHQTRSQNVSGLSKASFFFFLIYSRADKTLQDIVYKLVPGLFKGKVADVRAEETLRRLFFECVAFVCASRR